MKPTLTLTDFIENKDNDKYSVELIGTVDRKMIKLITRPVSLESVDQQVKTGIFIRALSGLTLQAATSLTNEGKEFHYPAGMNLTEQLSLFEIKQTPNFSNNLHASGIGTDVILVAIW